MSYFHRDISLAERIKKASTIVRKSAPSGHFFLDFSYFFKDNGSKMKTSYGTALPVYCSSSFDWKGTQGSCNSSELIKVDTEHMVGDFKGVLIKSSRTGIVKYFEPVYDEDGYDGEFMVYTCAQPNQSESFFVTIWRY